MLSHKVLHERNECKKKNSHGTFIVLLLELE